MFLIEEQTKILKFMSEMTGRVDMNEFAKKMGLTSSQIIEEMQELTKEGFLKKIGGGFALTEKGRTALKGSASVAWNMRFNFYTAVDQPTGVSAGSIKEFHDLLLRLNVTSLEFHLYRGDFENWFKNAAGDPTFADELAKIKKTGLKSEELRKAIAKIAEARYGF
jgi:DNA-binding Lrp family transcriptional regulator